MPGVGILGIGTHLPPDVRGNDYWPAEVVARWMAQRAAAPPPPAATSAAMARVVAALRDQAADPFRGVIERRVLAAGLGATDMEVAAARDAIAAAGIEPAAIDLLLVHTAVPDELLANTACPLHHRLGLAPACLSIEAQAAAYSFVAQLAIAEAMIAAGRARVALLVQSAAASRLIDRDSPISPLFGDGATAVVVGPVGAGRGVITAVHRTDGAYARALVAAVPGGSWYDAGRPVLYNADPAADRRVFLETLDRIEDAVTAVLGAAGMAVGDVDFFAPHQGTPWLRRLAQDHVGLGAARSIDTFAHTAYLFAASIPLSLARAEAAGTLRPDDIVLLFGGGTGMTYGATLLRWGRA